ncbi:MAG: hypothetical protein BRC40_13990, partial [Cyanobacteria bacterium QH_8_48_120]
MKPYVPFFYAILLSLGIVPAAVAQASVMEGTNLEPTLDETSSYSSSIDRESERSELLSSAIAPIALETLLSPPPSKELPSRKPKWKQVQISESDGTPTSSSKEAHADVLPNREISHKSESDFPLTEAEHLNQDFLRTGAGSSKVLSVAQAVSIIPVTGVQLNRTDRGLEVILETPGEKEPQVFKTSYGSTLAIDVPNTQLRLPEEQGFRQENPTSGIASVEVVQQNPNSIRVIVTGTEAVPTAKVVPSPEGVAFSVTSPTPAAEQPPTPEAEPSAPTPTAPERPEPAPPTAEGEEPIELVVTATRTEEEEENVPRSVTVITREQIEEQASISRNLTEILGQTVPSLQPSPQNRNAAQSLRGREASVLVDGVPINYQLGAGRGLRTIAPSAIERIEVVRGPNAIYGADATGGTINIITRPPVEEGLVSTVEVGVDAAIGEAFLPEDSFGNYLRYGLSGATEKVDFRLNLSRDYTGAFFDGGGDRIPTAEPRTTANNEALNILGKAGINFTDEQRLELTVNHFDSEQQELEYRSDPDTSPGEKPVAIEVGPIELEGENEPIQEQNTIVNLNYTHDDLLGSQLQLQGYYRDRFEVQDIPGFDDRIVDPDTGGIQQPVTNADELGARLQVDTPLSSSANLLWGFDYSDQEQEAIAILSDVEIFEATDGQRSVSTGTGTFVPPFTLKDLGIFAQLRWDLTERLRLDGGARYTNIDFSVDDYTTVRLPVRDIGGGNLSFDDVVFNLGATYQVTEILNLFASFSQGFSAPNFTSILLDPPEGTDNITDEVRLTSPVVVDNYEIGLRGNWQSVQAKISAFFNTSELGQSLVLTETGQAGDATLVRTPERIYGVETTLDWQPGRNWQLGGSLTFQEGKNDTDDDGEFLAISSRDIAPLTIRAYLENQTTPDWRNRLQLIYVGNRDRAFEDDVDPVAIDGYIVVDLVSE